MCICNALHLKALDMSIPACYRNDARDANNVTVPRDCFIFNLQVYINDLEEGITSQNSEFFR